MPAPNSIHRLIEQFHRNRADYISGAYNEAQLRQEFLNPFFEALGWDVNNRQGFAVQYREVIHEDSIDVDGSKKAPDYAFRIGGMRKFFVEAKKPAENIETDARLAYQLRRYAWNAHLPLSILTEFEEFAVYDCRSKPDPNDSPATSRIMMLHYEDYPERWDEIADIFSPDAILKGAFDRYAADNTGKKGTIKVDDAFLADIESWRTLLARNIALRNPQVADERQLNFAVQMIIDRLIFLRICEDRQIEPEKQLLDLALAGEAYPALVDLFHRADLRYNSGLFHFKDESGETSPADTLTPNLTVDDRVLREIVKDLYYPSPYIFNEIPVEILGQVYEQFLGRVIRLTPGHRAKVEEKPEVRKAGGVYYTPKYIVDYIVENTVGRLLEGGTPKEAADLKIVDPACGSGSFLLGAFQYLLRWHEGWYLAHDPETHAKGTGAALVPAEDGGWRISTAEKKRILLNNIFGVDIDAQAVEVTKLSLLLKVLEGETGQLSLGFERVLPDLGKNIQCGNSLIGPDYFEGKQMGLFSEEELYRINAFDWRAAFPEVFARGGFDAVIGNPPYVDIKGLPEVDAHHLLSAYKNANNRINLFAIFIEKSLAIINRRNSWFSMIVPTALLTQESYRELRKSINSIYSIANITRLPNESFGKKAGDVKVDTVIIVITNKGCDHVEIISYSGYERIHKIIPENALVHRIHKVEEWIDNENSIWSLTFGEISEDIISKCNKNSVSLEKCVDITLGITPYDKYKGHTKSQIKNKEFHSNYKKNNTFKPLLAGNDVRRYSIIWNGKQWISYGPWLGAPREQRFFTDERILIKQIIDWTKKRIWASKTSEELYNTQNAFNLIAREGWNINYILGIINSKLITYYHRKKFLDEFKMRFQKVLIKDARKLPIHSIDDKNPNEINSYNRINILVNQMIDLTKQLANAQIPNEKTRLQRQIDATDAEIDRLVYKLYGLTEEEIRIVEESVK